MEEDSSQHEKAEKTAGVIAATCWLCRSAVHSEYENYMK